VVLLFCPLEKVRWKSEWDFFHGKMKKREFFFKDGDCSFTEKIITETTNKLIDRLQSLGYAVFH
jgi:hypothetical protein